jgi:hypothetical protein
VGGSRTPVRAATSGVAATATTGAESSGGDGCTLVSQSPEDGTHYEPKKSFNTSWKVKNTGSSAWDSDTVDFAYSSGAMIHKKQFYALPADVPAGQSLTLTVSMQAPNPAGTYFTVWSLRRGQTFFCHVNLTIVVP